MTTESFYLLVDREPDEAEAGLHPPAEAVMGLWPVEADGTVGRFRGNPEYRPRDEDAPSDPIDALLRLVVDDPEEVPRLRLVLHDSLFDVAMNGDGLPLVTRSPDDVLCVVVATGAPHRKRAWTPAWRRVGLDDLTGMLAEGWDVFVNPGAASAVRLSAAFIRETAALTDDQLAEAAQAIPGSPNVAVVAVDDDTQPEEA